MDYKAWRSRSFMQLHASFIVITFSVALGTMCGSVTLRDLMSPMVSTTPRTHVDKLQQVHMPRQVLVDIRTAVARPTERP